MTEDEMNRRVREVRDSVEAECKAHPDDLKTVPEKLALIRKRSAFIVCLIQEHGMAKDSTDLVATIMALAQCAGCSGERFGMQLSTIIQMVLDGQSITRQDRIREANDPLASTEALFARMSKNPKGDA